MANRFDSNPIAIDTVTSNIDVGNSAFGLSSAPFFVHKVVLAGAVDGDKIVMTDTNGETVCEINVGANDTANVEYCGFKCVGLNLTAASQTLDSGTVYIYV